MRKHPKIFDTNVDTWDKWLSVVESALKDNGYSKYAQNHKGSDFGYWKTVKEGDNKLYQLGVLFYDFRKYINTDPYSNYIGIQFEVTLLGGDRIDLTICSDITLDTFECAADDFYYPMKQYLTIK